MFELFRAGGPLMWIILICSMVAVTIIIERLLTLRTKQVAPENLSTQILELAKTGRVSAEKLKVIGNHSPLGTVFAAGLANMSYGREAMREALEESGKHVVHNLGRYLNALGTIASITPLIGLLGTVIGMIEVFAAIADNGIGDPTVLSGGISVALITTASGLLLVFHVGCFIAFFVVALPS